MAGHVLRVPGLALEVAQLSGLNFPAQILEPLLAAPVQLLHLSGDQLSRSAGTWVGRCIAHWRTSLDSAPDWWPSAWHLAFLGTSKADAVVVGSRFHGYGHLLGRIPELSHFDTLAEAGVHHPLLGPQDQGATAFAVLG